jgi:hypothetical protein
MLITFFGRQGSELAPEDAASLGTHVAACPECAAAVQFERSFDDRVAQAMLAVPVPAGLKGKLLDGVAAQQGTWYRQKAYALVGMAACLLIAIGGVVAWQVSQAQPLSLAQIAADADQRDEDQRAVKVREFLAHEGVPFHPEQPIDLGLVEAYGVRDFQGKQVPALFLVNTARNARATVYVVRDSDFQWKKLPQDGSSVISKYGYQIAVLRDTERPGIGYVVVFTGAGLELFLENRSSL